MTHWDDITPSMYWGLRTKAGCLQPTQMQLQFMGSSLLESLCINTRTDWELCQHERFCSCSNRMQQKSFSLLINIQNTKKIKPCTPDTNNFKTYQIILENHSILEEYTQNLTVQTFHCILCKRVYLHFTNNFAYQKKKQKVTEDTRNTHIKTAFPG